MTDWKFLMFGATCVTTLAYCLWKTQADWQQKGLSFAAASGVVACLGAFFSVAFLVVGQVLADL